MNRLLFLVGTLAAALPVSGASGECMQRSPAKGDHAPAVILVPVDEIGAYRAIGYRLSECGGLFFAARATMESMCAPGLQDAAVANKATKELGVSPAVMCQSGKRAALPLNMLGATPSSMIAETADHLAQANTNIAPAQ